MRTNSSTPYLKFIQIIFSLILITGCGYKPETLPDTYLSAIDFNQKGEHAFSKALRVNRSFENIDGISINLINLAITYRKLGDEDSAYRCLDEILNGSHKVSQVPEAAFIKSALYVDSGSYEAALEWADRALSFCKDKCLTEGRIYSLKAKMELLRGSHAFAAVYGSRGLRLNKG